MTAPAAATSRGRPRVLATVQRKLPPQFEAVRTFVERCVDDAGPRVWRMHELAALFARDDAPRITTRRKRDMARNCVHWGVVVEVRHGFRAGGMIYPALYAAPSFVDANVVKERISADEADAKRRAGAAPDNASRFAPGSAEKAYAAVEEAVAEWLGVKRCAWRTDEHARCTDALRAAHAWHHRHDEQRVARVEPPREPIPQRVVERVAALLYSAGSAEPGEDESSE